MIVTVGSQLIFTRSLKAEEFAVERFVVGITENGTDAGAYARDDDKKGMKNKIKFKFKSIIIIVL